MLGNVGAVQVVAVCTALLTLVAGSDEFGDHEALSSDDLFPYVVAVLRMNSYVGAGAYIHDDWVLTAADGLYFVNYKRGGSLLPVKYIRIHPYFDDSKPEYDVALLRMSRASGGPTYPVLPVRLQRRQQGVTATHFIVAAWTPYYSHQVTKGGRFPDSMEIIKRSRILSAKQLHPMEEAQCRRMRAALDLSGALMCLEPPPAADSCQREAGAPVVLNGVLWGVVSSWKSDDCKTDSGPIFVNMVAAFNISSWIDAVMQDLHWMLREMNVDEDNFI